MFADGVTARLDGAACRVAAAMRSEIIGVGDVVRVTLLGEEPSAVGGELIEMISTGAIDADKVFDLVLPLEQSAEGYRAMDERRASETLLIV